MKQKLEVRKPGRVAAHAARDEMSAKLVAAIADTDLEKASGGGGASGGVLGDRQWK